MAISRKTTTAFVLIVVFVMGALMVGYVYSANDTVRTLKYNARRADCIRDVQADADQEFRLSLTEFIAAGASTAERDLPRIQAAIDRMRHLVNWADTVKKVCPPALDGD